MTLCCIDTYDVFSSDSHSIFYRKLLDLTNQGTDIFISTTCLLISGCVYYGQ